MAMSKKAMFGGLLAAGVSFLAYAFTIGIYPTNFSFEWDEELKLHDGRVIVVHVKNTYERIHGGLGRYANSIPRDVEIGFDAGAAGRITKLFKGGDILLLEQKDGVWFSVLSISPYRKSNLLPGQNFGKPQNLNGQHAAILKGTQFESVSMCELPLDFQAPNFLMRHGDIADVAKLDGKLVTIKDKQDYQHAHPLTVSDVRIERPSPKSKLAC